MSSASFAAESQLNLFDTLATVPPILSPVRPVNAQGPDQHSSRKPRKAKVGLQGTGPRKKRRAVKKASAARKPTKRATGARKAAAKPRKATKAAKAKR